jgi:hypothetical protein
MAKSAPSRPPLPPDPWLSWSSGPSESSQLSSKSSMQACSTSRAAPGAAAARQPCALLRPCSSRSAFLPAFVGKRNAIAARAQQRDAPESDPTAEASKVQVPSTAPSQNKPQSQGQRSDPTPKEEQFSWQEFWGSDLPQKLGVLVGLIVLSRVGVYVRIPGVDVDAFAATMSSSGLMGYVDGERGSDRSLLLAWAHGHPIATSPCMS